MSTTFKHGDITDKIIHACFEVHKTLGNGFQEIIYQRALAYELGQAGLIFGREVEQDIFYKDLIEPIGRRRADFVVEKKVIVEIKAVSELDNVHFCQTLNYLRVYRFEVGLLVNFGSKSLVFRRVAL